MIKFARAKNVNYKKLQSLGLQNTKYQLLRNSDQVVHNYWSCNLSDIEMTMLSRSLNSVATHFLYYLSVKLQRRH